MTADLILKGSTIITMDPALPRAEAVAVDTSTGVIAAVGTLVDCQAAAPGVTPTDLSGTVLMPGFIEAHSHPLVAGIYTQQPSYWISRSQGYATYAEVTALWRKLDASLPAGDPVLCWGLERPTQGAPELTNTDLDVFFPKRPAMILDISGHEAYFNSAAIAFNGWTGGRPPADPPASRFGRNADGTSNGRAYETAAVEIAAGKVQQAVVTHPLLSAAKWFVELAKAGVTTTADNAFSLASLAGYEALASSADCPVRVGYFHVSTEVGAGEPVASKVPTDRLWKAGIKFWADGTTFNGTLAASFPFLDSATTTSAQIPLGPGAEKMTNYTRSQYDALLDQFADGGWQIATHAHGDVAIDLVLDAYAAVLTRHGLLGTDHRWRVEHWSAGRADQFRRAVDLGVCTPMAAYQFIQLGDLLDGELLASAIGSQWVAAGDAIKAGATVSFHSDSPVAPVNPLNDMQCMATRRSWSGQVHGANQSISLDDALKAHTINAAYHLRREHDLGSITPGKLADFVELSADPYTADFGALSDQVTVLGTWCNGRKIDTETFLADIAQTNPTEHAGLHDHALKTKHC